MKLDFFATQTHFIDHLKPIWDAFPQRGSFFVSENIKAHAQKKIGEVIIGQPKGAIYPVLTCSYGDMAAIVRDNPNAKAILAEHGIGMTYGTSAYADGRGRRKNASMFLMQSQYVANKIHPDLAEIPRHVIGIPKLDQWAGEFDKPHPMPKDPTIAISFHHSNFSNVPEAQNAWEEYREILPKLADKYHLIGTGHPLEIEQFSETYRSLGIEIVEDFNEVMRRADILIFDCTSAGYEFLVTGKPVILLDATKFRRNLQFGIRFWDYSNIGIEVSSADKLMSAIQTTIDFPNEHLLQRLHTIVELIPNIGKSTQIAVDILTDFLKTVPDPEPEIAIQEMIETCDSGIVYMCFGEPAKLEIEKSIESLRVLGFSYPVVIVGDTPVEGTYFVEWTGENPFDLTRKKGLQFLAGKIKPYLYGLSPFKKTLYVDADTRFRRDIQPGFDFLTTCDIATAEENQCLMDLHNPDPSATNISWYHHMPEVEKSIDELGNPSMRFLNSGVIFFRKGRHCERLFDDWHTEWLRWQQWDEQMAFLRAVKRNPHINIMRLPIQWNCPRPKGDVIIVHMYARGAARLGGI
jgi:hypothetical protein